MFPNRQNYNNMIKMSLINNLFDIAFNIIYILVFYISLKICFLREGKSKVMFFVLVLLTNPVTIFPVSLVLGIFVEKIIYIISSDGSFVDPIKRVSENDMPLSLFLLAGFIFILLILLFSHLMGRWLKAHNISLVTFVYLMFGVVCSLSGETVSGNNIIDAISPDVQEILQKSVFIATVLLLYRFVIRDLSKLTGKRRQISWKMLLIPPVVFLPVYYVFDYLTFKYGDGVSNIVVRVYSMIVQALFIWAFSVIIRNINASNAAIEAQYEAEHDKLTGLYNKGKYMMMKEDHFGNPGSIALFNFDVNNLKYINDNFGHEYGDELITKAAQSIHAVTSNNIFGFRMGGDEYAVVALDVTEKETQEIRNRWEKALAELNTKGNVHCVMACGLKYIEGEFDTDELFHRADDQMYLDKKARKDRGETSTPIR